MKVITEAILRDLLRGQEPESYEVPKGKILSPAAREYLQQRKVKIIWGIEGRKYPVIHDDEDKPAPRREESSPAQEAPPAPAASSAPMYIDYESGAFYAEKPEHMTQLHRNELVAKDHPRIYFRGRLDSSQALVVLAQVTIKDEDGANSAKLMVDLGDILATLREIMRCDVLDQPFRQDKVIGYSLEELRDRSHNPMKYFSVKQMVLPDYSLGKTYALLNQLRTDIRETEVAATRAFRLSRNVYDRKDIIEALNRLSSAVHIMMCKYLAEEYKG
ncbi:MAG: ATP-binding protein [Synergistaceae bacterium]|nr:ATP-binding protein [Synergistaceae bacterium]